MASQHIPTRTGVGTAQTWTASEMALRLVGALLALAVSAVHVADQAGMTAMASPDWIGWGYRLIEAGGVLTAIALVLVPLASLALSARLLWSALARGLGWAAGVLLGAGPFLAYIASRTVGMPGDPGDVGNWNHWVGTVSLLVEAALVALSAGMLLSLRHSGRPQMPRLGRQRDAEVTRPSDSSGRKARVSCGAAAPRALSSTWPSARCPTRPARFAPARLHCRRSRRPGLRARPDPAAALTARRRAGLASAGCECQAVGRAPRSGAVP